MQLDGRIAELETLIGHIEELLDGCESGRQCIGGYRLAVGAKQTVNGNAENTAFEIPQRDVHDSEQPDRELLGPVEFPEAMPQPLPPVGPLTDELFSKDTVDDVGE